MSKKIELTSNVYVSHKQAISKTSTFCGVVLLAVVFMAGCQKDSSSSTVPQSSLSSNLRSAPTDVDPAPLNLGTAGNFTILAATGISTTGTTSVTGNMGVSPISSTAITGFGLIKD